MPKINARCKGNSYELKIAKLFKDLGWGGCVSSRSESKRTDDAGIDLCYTNPFTIQCKANERLGSHHDILASMPQKAGRYNLIFHKRNHKGSVVVMSEKDFVTIVKLLIEAKVITPEC